MVLLPKCSFEESIPHALFYLAGPVTGGGRWQVKAHELLTATLPKEHRFIAAFPYSVNGESSLDGHYLPNRATFDDKITWEQHYMDLAYKPSKRNGCVIFWLPKEDRENLDKGNLYARDTYVQLGELVGRLMCGKNLRVVVGAEPEFPGLARIRKDLQLRLRREFTIYPTLGETVQAAVRMSTIS